MEPLWSPCDYAANAIVASRTADGYLSLAGSGCREHLPAALTAALAPFGIRLTARFPLGRVPFGPRIARSAPLVPATTLYTLAAGLHTWPLSAWWSLPVRAEVRGRMVWPSGWRGDWVRQACEHTAMNLVSFERHGLRYVGLHAQGCGVHLGGLVSREAARLGMVVVLKP